ncbi:MAG TPA: hypothetical protein VIM02_01420 [Rhizomicrobium sp.]|jgi:hypothetical protein
MAGISPVARRAAFILPSGEGGLDLDVLWCVAHGPVWNESIGAAVQKSTVFDCRIRKSLLRKYRSAP